MMGDNDHRPDVGAIYLTTPAAWVATWFGCGLLKPAPGTWGTVGGLPYALLLLAAGGWPALLAGVVVVTVAGWWAAGKIEKQTGAHDSGYIVIDEVAGIGVALLPAALNPVSIALAFLLFRFFDIVKPWPVSWCDKKLPGAAGVMADDLVAGIMAALCLWGIQSYARLH